MQEMEILHHFTTVTAHTLGDQAYHQRLWQTVVPKLAFAHDFLMHGILAISAMHMANMRPAEQSSLSVIAANHQDIGLQEFRSELGSMSSQNCDALFAFSILVIFYIPASSESMISEDKTTSSFLNGNLFIAILDWIRLLRGIQGVADRGRQWLENGPMAPLMVHSSWRREVEPADERSKTEDQYLASLDQLWVGTAKYTEQEREEAKLYDRALLDLRQAFARMSIARSTSDQCGWCTDTTIGDHIPRLIACFIWYLNMPNEFFALIEQKRPIALILLAHHAIVFKRMDALWWLEAAPVKVVNSISAILPTKYYAWIDWPSREVQANNTVSGQVDHRQSSALQRVVESDRI